jgi:hypothetical protein
VRLERGLVADGGKVDSKIQNLFDIQSDVFMLQLANRHEDMASPTCLYILQWA